MEPVPSQGEKSSQIFISYSRDDRQFLDRLIAAFKTRQLKPWYDTEAIPKGAKWWKEIEKGIESSEAFLFIITLNALESKVCNWELAHAIRLGKKIIPLLRSDVFKDDVLEHDLERLEWEDPMGQSVALKTNWDHLIEINFIPFCESDDFESSINDIVKVAQADFEFTAKHTKLVVRAREWELNEYNKSFLLRGIDLTQAEEWLSVSSGKKPQPSALQNRYILSSRKAEKQRSRRLLSGVSIALVVAITLAVTSFMFYRQALHRQRLSEGLRLSAQAEIESKGQFPDRAVLLALEALDHYPYTIQAEQSLANAVLKSHLLAIWDAAERINRFSWSSNSQFLTTFHENDRVKIWDTASQTEINTISASQIAWSPSKSLLAYSSGTETIILDPASREIRLKIPFPIFQYEPHVPNTSFNVWSRDGKLIITEDQESGKSQIWNVLTGDKVKTFEGTGGTWCPNQKSIYTASNATIWHYRRGLKPFRLRGLKKGEGATGFWSNDGRYLLSPNWHQIYLFDGKRGRLLHDLSGELWKAFAPQWCPHDNRFVISQHAGPGVNGVVVWDAEKNKNMGYIELVSRGTWSPDGKLIAMITRDGTLRICNGRTLDTVYEWRQYDNYLKEGKITALAWSNDKQILASGSDSGTVQLWDLQPPTRPVPDRLKERSPLIKLKEKLYSPDGRYYVQIVEKKSVNTGKDVIGIFDSKTNSSLHSIRGYNATWSPDGNKVALIFSDFDANLNQVIVFNMLTGKQEAVFDLPHLMRIHSSPTWSPDGLLLAIGYTSIQFQDYAVRAWELSSKNLVVSDSAFNLSWSPNSRRLATLDVDGVVKVWDTAYRQQLYEFEIDDFNDTLKWTDDGRYIYTSGGIWRGWQDLSDLVGYARKYRAVRQLTSDERLALQIPKRN
jgi:WD40 repeat protein